MLSMMRVYKELQHRFPAAFWQGNGRRHELALTFDDGPHAASTPALLALLERQGVRATFFHIGQRAAAAPHLVQRVRAAGHQIGLHGYNHRSFLLESRQGLLAKLAQSQRVLVEASGGETAQFWAVRPPYGHFSPAVLATLSEAGYLPTMWSVVPFHWLQPAEATVRQAVGGVYNGAILVLHEAMPGPPVVELTATILPKLIDAGYGFVTVDELWASRLG
jgi:peptidoglycan/xylan/chitin deacetylase (PgdA/CDA1 family)